MRVPSLVVEVANETRQPVRRALFHDVAARARNSVRLPVSSQVQLTLVNDHRMRALNRRTRRLNAATDVLAFPLHARRDLRKCPRDPDGVCQLGDIVISLSTARRQARAGRTSLQQELTTLFAHGLLHVLGYDHQTERAHRHMRRLSNRLAGISSNQTESCLLSR